MMNKAELTKLSSRLWEEEESVKIDLSWASRYVHAGNSILSETLLKEASSSPGSNLRRLHF